MNMKIENVKKKKIPFIWRLYKKRIEPLFIELINPNWYKDAVGGLWDEYGSQQFDYLVKHGMRPNHYLLDVGCGSLRGGIHSIPYLEDNHYFGIDISRKILRAGNAVVKKNNLVNKVPTLVRLKNFEFQELNQKFDFAVAQSVFTHITLNDIIVCLRNIEEVLVDGGKFFVTFFENKEGKFNINEIGHKRVDNPSLLVTNFNKDPFHYDFETFKWVCDKTKLKVEYIGHWEHPRDQMMMVFTKI